MKSSDMVSGAVTTVYLAGEIVERFRIVNPSISEHRCKYDSRYHERYWETSLRGRRQVST